MSFRLGHGHIHALIGPNGAGKSTMINMITGVITPDEGSIQFLGTEIGGEKIHAIARRGVAGPSRIFASSRTCRFSRTCSWAATAGCQTVSGSRSALPSARREEASARPRGLNPRVRRPVRDGATAAGSLAYGLQRRVELARALATEPQLLLLDEPAAGLNPQETAELGRLIVKIRGLGITILMVEHHMDLVMGISDHVIVLDYGVKIAEGEPVEVQANPV